MSLLCHLCFQHKQKSDFSNTQQETSTPKCWTCMDTFEGHKCYSCNVVKEKRHFSNNQMKTKGKYKRCKKCIIQNKDKNKGVVNVFTDKSIVKTFNYAWKVYSTPIRSILLCNGYIRRFIHTSTISTCVSCIRNICCNYFEANTIRNRLYYAHIGSSKCSKIFVVDNCKWMIIFSSNKYINEQPNAVLHIHFLGMPIYGLEINSIVSLYDRNQLIGHERHANMLNNGHRTHYVLSIPKKLLYNLSQIEFRINIKCNNSKTFKTNLDSFKSKVTNVFDTFSWKIPKNFHNKFETKIFEMFSCKWYLQLNRGGILYLYRVFIPYKIGAISMVYELMLQQHEESQKFVGTLLFKNRVRKTDFRHLYFFGNKYSGILQVKFSLIDIFDVYNMKLKPPTVYPKLKFIPYPKAYNWKVLYSTMDFITIISFIRPLYSGDSKAELHTIARLCHNYFSISKQNKIISPIFIMEGLQWIVSVEKYSCNHVDCSLQLLTTSSTINVKIKCKIVCNELNRIVSEMREFKQKKTLLSKRIYNPQINIKHLHELSFNIKVKRIVDFEENADKIKSNMSKMDQVVTKMDHISWKVTNTNTVNNIKYFHFEMFSMRWWLKIYEKKIYLLLIRNKYTQLCHLNIFYELLYKSCINDHDEQASIQQSGYVIGESQSYYEIGKYEEQKWREIFFYLRIKIADAYYFKFDKMESIINGCKPCKKISAISISNYRWRIPLFTQKELDSICPGFCKQCIVTYVPMDIIQIISAFINYIDEFKRFKNSGNNKNSLTIPLFEIPNSMVYNYRICMKNEFKEEYLRGDVVAITPKNMSVHYEAYVTFEEIHKTFVISENASDDYYWGKELRVNAKQYGINNLESFTLIFNVTVLDILNKNRESIYNELVDKVELL
eukprot:481857_1